MSDKRTRQKASTREHIMQTAYGVYASRGFLTPTSVIAAEAGVSHGAIFAHFPTREALINGMLERFGGEMGARLHDLSQSGGLKALLTAHLVVLRQYESFYMRLVSEASSLPADARYTLIAIQSVASQHFSAAAQRDMAEGRIRRAPMHILFNAWLGLVHHYLQNADLFVRVGSVLEGRGGELVNGYWALIRNEETEE